MWGTAVGVLREIARSLIQLSHQEGPSIEAAMGGALGADVRMWRNVVNYAMTLLWK